MLEKVMQTLGNLDAVKFNSIYKERVMADATEMYNNGWEALEDGVVVLTKGNLVAVKKGNAIVNYEMADFNVNLGKLDGNIKKMIEEKEVPEDKKNAYLAQTIITKYYTQRTM